LDKREIKDKVVLLRVKGELQRGKISDVKFQKIEDFAKTKEVYFLLRNTHDLKTKEFELEIGISEKNSENIEGETINIYAEQNPSDLNSLIEPLMSALSTEKQEDEKTEIFTNRLLSEAKKVLGFWNDN